jgi:hypothetical protein
VLYCGQTIILIARLPFVARASPFPLRSVRPAPCPSPHPNIPLVSPSCSSLVPTRAGTRCLAFRRSVTLAPGVKTSLHGAGSRRSEMLFSRVLRRTRGGILAALGRHLILAVLGRQETMILAALGEPCISLRSERHFLLASLGRQETLDSRSARKTFSSRCARRRSGRPSPSSHRFALRLRLVALTLYKLSSTQSRTNIRTLLPSSLLPFTSRAVTLRYRAPSSFGASCSHSSPVLKLYRGVGFFAGGDGAARRDVVWMRRRWRFIVVDGTVSLSVCDREGKKNWFINLKRC